MAEGGSTAWIEQMAGIVECPICTETFSNNRLLPCGHTFCLKCLEDHRKACKPRGKALFCPVCRKEFTIPKGGLSALPKNYSVQQMIDAHDQQKEDKDTTRCDICDSDKETTSVLYCLQCDQNLCTDCEQMHRKMKSSSHHHAVPVSKKEQLKEFPDESHCADHPDLRVELFCVDCNSLICWKCKCLEHHSHDFDEIDEMTDRFKEQLLTNIEESENRMSILYKISANLKDKETQQQVSLEKEKNSICKISAEMIRSIVTNEDALLKQVTAAAQRNLKQLQPHRERLEKQMDELKQHTAAMKQLCDYGKPWELFRRSNELHDKTAEFLRLEITSTEVSLECVPESDIRKQLLAAKVDVQMSSRDSSSGEYVNFSRPQVPARSPSLITTAVPKDSILKRRSVASTGTIANSVGGVSAPTKDILTRMKKSSPSQFLEIGRIAVAKEGRAVCGVTVLSQDVYIIHDRCPEIQVYDLTNFSLRSKINIDGLVQPNDLASCNIYNCIYIVDWTEQTIHRVEIEGSNEVATKWNTGKEFGGISRSHDSNVILAGYLTGIIREYSTKGDLIREVLLKPDIREIIHPWHALKLPSGEFVISHGSSTAGLHRVCLVDANGNVTKSFGGSKGLDKDKLFGPYHLALASNGDVFVADCNNRRVVRLNANLQFENEIRMNVRRPRRLCFELTSNKLLVADNEIMDGNKASDGAIVILEAK